MHMGLTLSQLVARAVDHRCEQCPQLLAVDRHAGVIPRSWFHTWRISCERCGLPIVSASKAPWATLPDLFPGLWGAAVEGERLLAGAVGHTGPVASTLPTSMLRMLMISTARDAIPEHSGRTLDVIIPGFNAILSRHRIAIPFSTLIDVPLPVRTALLA